MEVLVVRLRREGRKLPKEALEQPVAGHLKLDLVNMAGEVQPVAALTSADTINSPALLLNLYDARLRRIRGDSLLLVGHEGCGPGTPEHAQAWWCRLRSESQVMEQPAPQPCTHGTALPPRSASASSRQSSGR